MSLAMIVHPGRAWRSLGITTDLQTTENSSAGENGCFEWCILWHYTYCSLHPSKTYFPQAWSSNLLGFPSPISGYTKFAIGGERPTYYAQQDSQEVPLCWRNVLQIYVSTHIKKIITDLCFSSWYIFKNTLLNQATNMSKQFSCLKTVI